jgi:adenylate cyclase
LPIRAARQLVEVQAEKSGRKLAAIMFTDMVGFTALNQSNESRALEVLERHNRILRPLFAKHNGKEVKTIGDSFLVEFDSALDATLCALEVQEFLHDYNISSSDDWKIKLRIGIHLGDVVRKGDDILGDAVNIASRIQSLANPEGICVTEQVYDQIQNKIESPLFEIEKADLKNVKFPIKVYSIQMSWDPKIGSPQTHRDLDPHRLAVLPFSSLSPDPNDEYFADGMTEEMTSCVSMIPELSVISRTSVMQYKNQTKDVSEISSKLKVGTLLEGSVRKSGNRVRIAVQLIDANNDKHLWAENYDRTLEDIFEIQSDIAQRVASTLRIRLLEGDRKKIQHTPTTDTEAHDFYLKGLYHTRQATYEEYMVGLQFLEKATKRDPGFALAYTEIANIYGFLGLYEIMQSTEAIEKSAAAAKRALELDQSLAEAHVSMAFVLSLQWNFEEATKENRRALELNPNLPRALTRLALDYHFSWKFDKGLDEVRKALELDPMSTTTLRPVATWHLYTGHVREAQELFERALEVSPDDSFSHGNLGLCYVKMGKFDAGISEIKKGIEMTKRFNPATRSDLIYALCKAGRIDEAKNIIPDLLRYYVENRAGAAAVAFAYACLGEKDKAFEWLDIAYEEHSGYLRTVSMDFSFEDMHSDPRFLTFLKKMKIIH